MAHWASYRQFATNKTMHVQKNCSRQIVVWERKTLLELWFFRLVYNPFSFTNSLTTGIKKLVFEHASGIGGRIFCKK